MTGELVVFVLFAALALGSAIVVVAHRNPVYSTMSLVATLFSTAVLFVLLGAPFIAALQILLYTGAILVLFLFVIMLLNVQRERGAIGRSPVQSWGAAICGLVLVGMLASLTWAAYGDTHAGEIDAELVSLEALAAKLFDSYLLPFEIIGLLLLVAVVAATVVARRPSADEEIR